MGLSGKMGGRGISYARHKNEEARKSLLFAAVRSAKKLEKAPDADLFQAPPGTSFRLVTANKTQTSNSGH
jgi:hypothetical protein